MRKTSKILAFALAAILLIGGVSVPASAAALTASPTSSTVYVNGQAVAFDAYNISDNNYFKLRDLAYTLSGTAAQFDVGWDGANNAISLTNGKAYTAVGGEMTGKGAGNKTTAPTSSKIYLDGKEVTLTSYNIDGNNYFKLRDIGLTFDFGVTWDGANNAIVIDTSVGYTPESGAVATNPPGDANYRSYGYVAQSGDWICYSNGNDGGKLYRIKADGTGKAKVVDDKATFINVQDDWVYYAAYISFFEPSYLYKVRIDGTGKTLLDKDCALINVIGDWIYYAGNSGNGPALHRIKTDGTGKTQLNNDDCINVITVVDDWVYYIYRTDDNVLTLGKTRTDGTGRTRLGDGEATFFMVYDGWVYYTGENWNLYKIRTDGTGMVKISNEIIPVFFVIGDWIYYTTGEGVTYKIKTDGTGKTESQFTTLMGVVNIFGDWIYRLNGQQLCKIKVDGTDDQPFG